MKLLELKRTKDSAPTQYEGKLSNGKLIYIRYRWGTLTIRVSRDITKNIDDAVTGRIVFQQFIGSAYDGSIEHDPVIYYLAKAKINTELVA
jgi:hypothetical protein